MKLITIVSLLSLATANAVVLHVDPSAAEFEPTPFTASETSGTIRLSPDASSHQRSIDLPALGNNHPALGTPATIADQQKQPFPAHLSSGFPSPEPFGAIPTSFNPSQTLLHKLDPISRTRTAAPAKTLTLPGTPIEPPSGASKDDPFTKKILFHMGVSGFLILLILGSIGVVDYSRRNQR